jgi:starch synthase
MSGPERSFSVAAGERGSGEGLALVSRGDALTPYLLAALARRFPVSATIDPELSAPQRYLVAALTFRLTRSKWVERFYKSNLATRLRSANARRQVALLRSQPAVAVQVHALFQLSGLPSVLYIDCTHAQSAALWPAWNPLRGRSLEGWYRNEREIYRAAEHLFAFSEATKASLVSDYGLPPEKVTVTGAGVNFLQLPEVPTRTHPRSSHPTILFVGNDFVRKGGVVLLEAFANVRRLIPDARLQLVGLDPDIRAQPGVEVLGSIRDRERVAELYRSAAVFVVPSFFDPFPLVALEAMAFGLPVIASRQMGTPEMIVDGVTGKLVEPGDVVALTDALLEVLRDSDSADQLGAAARLDVLNRLTWDAVVDRMAPVLEKLSARVDR